MSNLMLHAGGRLCTPDELRAVPTLAAAGRWHPVAHAAVLDTVTTTLTAAGYAVKSQALTVARDGKRFFGTLDLTTPLTPDGTVALAVGIRNSTDKSFPLGFCAGARLRLRQPGVQRGVTRQAQPHPVRRPEVEHRDRRGRRETPELRRRRAGADRAPDGLRLIW